jgi:hypothetical protein
MSTVDRKKTRCLGSCDGIVVVLVVLVVVLVLLVVALVLVVVVVVLIVVLVVATPGSDECPPKSHPGE